MLDIFNRFLDVIDVIITMTYLTFVLTPRFKIKYRVLFDLMSSLVIIITNWKITQTITGLPFQIRLSSILSVIIIALYSFALFKDSFGKKSIQFTIIFATVFIMDALGTVVMCNAYDLKPIMKQIPPAAHLFAHMVYIMGTIFVFAVLYLIFKKKDININKQQGIILILFIFVEVFMIMNTVYVHSSNITTSMLISLLCEMAICIIIDVIVILSMKKMAQMIDEENQIIVKQFNATHIEEIKAENDKFKLLQNNILSTIQNTKELIVKNENPNAKELLNSFNYDVDNTNSQHYCENHLINTVINLKMKEASENNIVIDSNIICPESINVEAYDLCNIFCNILDNAIDYCDVKTNNTIKISAKVAANQYIINCENAYSKSNTKKNRTGHKKHGYGLKIVTKLCKKYDGEISVSKNKNSFSISLMITV